MIKQNNIAYSFQDNMEGKIRSLAKSNLLFIMPMILDIDDNILAFDSDGKIIGKMISPYYYAIIDEHSCCHEDSYLNIIDIKSMDILYRIFKENLIHTNIFRYDKWEERYIPLNKELRSYEYSDGLLSAIRCAVNAFGLKWDNWDGTGEMDNHNEND